MFTYVERSKRKPRVAPAGFRYTTATAEELADYKAKHNGRGPARNVKHLTCNVCEKRMWGSGLAIGSHRNVCRPTVADLADDGS